MLSLFIQIEQIDQNTHDNIKNNDSVKPCLN